MKFIRIWKSIFTKSTNHMTSSETFVPKHQNHELSPEGLRALFRNCADVKMDKYDLGDAESIQAVYLFYCEGLADVQQINEYVLPRLESMLHHSKPGMELDKKLELTQIVQTQDMITRVFSGQLLIYYSGLNTLYALDIASPPHRNPSESNTEISIKGPRDGFVEELTTNVALVRKRLRTNSLCYEQFTIGTRSNCKVALLYIEDIIQPEIIREARARLKHIDIDILLGGSQLEVIISDSSSSIFPLLDYSGRPDYVADCLVHGRFAIIVDGGPNAIIGPANLTLLLKSPEDPYFPFYYSTFGMFLRLIGLITTLLLPGFWTALSSYNIEQIPYPLVATISMSRIGLPLPGPLEAFLMIGMFELFREAGERLPKAVGQTVAVVGGIVVGDAAIRAGLASTTLLVVAALTAVSSFTLVNQSLTGSVSIIRLCVLVCSSVLGMYGFILSVIAIVFYLSRLESFGVPYLAPLSPITWKDVVAAVTRKPWHKMNRRPEILNTKDSSRRGKS
ncbi:spore germination protein [Paenibacillus chartarius]|uniref:Spore germination protein n=1 Tax=Paenibacillus chartarius TaxID=747481 RepID=A0ABV6DJN5_9BACL